MTRCSGIATSACTGAAIGLYRWSFHEDSRPLCAACKAAMERMGLYLAQDVTSWRSRAIAKSLPGKLFAA